ncbi:MAG TPA: twin-arginine translocase subunit TatC [Candidatus Limnocylindrales bacterium]
MADEILPGGPTPVVGSVVSEQPSAVMPLLDHLNELRNRVFKSILAVLIASTVGWFSATTVRNYLLDQLPGHKAQVLGPGDAFFIQIKISLTIGVILAMPVLLYQLWAFIAPGLTPAERKTIRPWIPLALLLFAIGVGIAFIVLPYAIAFLLGFTDNQLVNGIAAGPYFDFVTTLFLAFGLIMEFPIILYGLALVGIVSSQWMSKNRRMLLLGVAAFAFIVTPGGDLVSPSVLAVTMIILTELTRLAIKRSGR